MQQGEELLRLWELARVLAAHDMAPQAITTLEAVLLLCASSSDANANTNTNGNGNGNGNEEETRRVAACANALLAEICVVTAPSKANRMDRKLWRKRLARAERCIHAAEHALLAAPSLLSNEWRCRLLKAKFLLAGVSKTERVAKNRESLETLCAAIQLCAASQKRAGDGTSAPESDVAAVAFKDYFLQRLRAHIVKLHGASLLGKYPENAEPRGGFMQSLAFVLENFPKHFDDAFQLWLIEVSCHASAMSFYFEGGGDATAQIDTAKTYFRRLTERTSASRELHAYHLVITGFYYLRTGEVKQLTPVLDELKTLLNTPDCEPTGILQEAYLSNVLDSLKLHAMARSDPCAALAFSTKAIYQVQANMQAYAQNKSVHVMLVGMVFDMLAVHCRLQGQQCRYFELGLSIAQMLQLFVTHKSTLEQTVLYKFFVARCHVLIAKYAVAIGKVKEAVVNINYVVEKLLPPIAATTTTYPDAFLSVWVDALDVLTHCGSAADPAFAAAPSGSPAPLVQQFTPNVVLLEFGARILEMEGLRSLVYSGCSVELRAKYDLALAKWLWGSRALAENPSSNPVGLGTHAALEALRPKVLALLQNALEQMGSYVGCSETLGELMALYGPALLAGGKTARGEETLKSAVQISLHTKNLLLQSRLLVAIFRLYASQQQAAAQATTVAKYEKKLQLLQRRIAQAQAEAARNKLIMRWKGGEPSGTVATPPAPSS